VKTPAAPRSEFPSQAALDREIRDALASIGPAAFRGVAALPGFRRQIRALLDEISEAATALEFAGAMARLPQATTAQRAIAQIYLRVERRLAARGLRMPGRSTPPLGASYGPVPGRVEKFTAGSRAHEAAEIARRIQERLARGESAKDIGVVLRQPAAYAPLLRSAFWRYRIPAAFHFAEPLGRQSPARFCAAVIESLLDGWNLERIHEAVVLPVSGLGATPEGDRLDFEIRARIPGRGFESLPQLEERFGRYGAWMTARHAPRAWVAELSALIDTTAAHTAAAGRQRALAANAWKEAVTEAAAALPDRECSLAQFWPEAAAAVAASVIRPAGADAEAVAVVDAREIWPWRFRAAYLCGLLEGEFPARPAGDAFFDNATRRELARLGVPLRTSDEKEADERELVLAAASRAEQVTLSWPAVTAAGEESLPALVVETFPGDPVSAPFLPPPLAAAYRPPARATLAPPEAVLRLAGSPRSWRPSEIDCFLQCPFQYLGRYTLQLQAPPPGPGERFDARAQGSLAHDVLRRVSENPALDLAKVLDEELRALARKHHIPDSHALLWGRTEMLRVLRRFLDTPAGREGWRSEYEWPFEFDLVDGIRVKGRIDRFDSAGGRAFAVDYKYSKSARLTNSASVQGGLYLLGLRAAGFAPEGFAYIALREDAEIVQFAPEPLMAEAREKTIAAVSSIRNGEIAARPADPSLCRWCDFRPACRISQAAALTRGEGGE
jgi:RecB family exonuclease